MSEPAVTVSFDPLDAVTPDQVEGLIAELREAGGEPELSVARARGVVGTEELVSLIGAATASTAVLSIVVAFLHRTFECGAVVDNTGGKVSIERDRSLPRGAVLMVPREGEPVLKRGVEGERLTDLLAKVVDSH